MIEQITAGGELLAIIVSSSFNEPGLHFLTTDELPLQMGFMHYDAGRVIEPHQHRKAVREISTANEALFIRKGKLRVDFYDNGRNYLKSRTLSAGDVILMVAGGHGFEAVEDLEMIEIKQGPYNGDHDRTRFEGRM